VISSFGLPSPTVVCCFVETAGEKHPEKFWNLIFVEFQHGLELMQQLPPTNDSRHSDDAGSASGATDGPTS
jgi:hypothetical protein